MAETRNSRMLVRLWADCFKSMRSLVIFSPFVMYAIFQAGLLLALIYFAYPPFSKILVPLIRDRFGEAALHYPNNYVVLALLFDWGNILLSGVVGVLLIGMATYLFAMQFHGDTPSFAGGMRRTLRRYYTLLAIWAVETPLILAAVLGLPTAASKLFGSGYAETRWPSMAGLFVAVCIGGLFAYTTALVVLSQRGILSAIAGSVKIFRKWPLISFLLVAVPTAIHFPVEYLAGKAPILVAKFHPEVMIVVVAVGIVISLFANYMLVGTVTYFFIHKTTRT